VIELRILGIDGAAFHWRLFCLSHIWLSSFPFVNSFSYLKQRFNAPAQGPNQPFPNRILERFST